MTDTELMQDNSEIVHYDRIGVPLYLRTSCLSSYPDMRALCHWHDDIELIHVLDGKMNYYINGKKILLKQNDCLMVNARQLHYGYAYLGQECRFSCILFHPALFTENRILRQNYISPVLENTGLEYLRFDSATAEGKEMADLIGRLASLKIRGEYAYELEAVGLIHIFWSRLLWHIRELPEIAAEKPDTDLVIQKQMVSYIHQHFAEKLALADIAASGHICRNKCCLIFRHYLQQSPIEFLNAYRLKVSCRLLADTDKSITEVAFACGFNHPSYFSKMFLENYGCTPGEYRKTRHSDGPCGSYK